MTIHTFKLTEAFYPNVYDGYTFHGEDKPTFGLSIKAEELPDHLRAYARRPKDSHGFNIITVSAGKVAPTVVTIGNRDVSTTLQCARDANLRLDDLLKKIPLELATEVIEFDNRERVPTSTLILRAIRLDYEDMMRRYNELCAEFWTGA